MKKKSLTEQSNCHHLSGYKTISNIFFCKNCSIILLKTKSVYNALTKPTSFNHPGDVSPKFFLHNFRKNFQISLNFEWNEQSTYTENRAEGIKFGSNGHTKYQTSGRSFYQSVRYGDQYFSVESISTNKEAIVAAVAFILSIKFCDNNLTQIPQYQNLIDSNGEPFDKKELKRKEISVLKAGNYNLSGISIYDTLLTVLNFGVLIKDDIKEQDKKFKNVFYKKAIAKLFEIINMNSIFGKYTYGEISLSVISLIKREFGLNMESNKVIDKIYNVPYDKYYQCEGEIMNKDMKYKGSYIKMEDTISRCETLLSKNKLRDQGQEPILRNNRINKNTHAYCLTEDKDGKASTGLYTPLKKDNKNKCINNEIGSTDLPVTNKLDIYISQPEIEMKRFSKSNDKSSRREDLSGSIKLPHIKNNLSFLNIKTINNGNDSYNKGNHGKQGKKTPNLIVLTEGKAKLKKLKLPKVKAI